MRALDRPSERPVRSSPARVRTSPPPSCTASCTASCADSCAVVPRARPHHASSDEIVRRGFNLIELLVVLAIVTILTATMLPGLAAAREATHRVICASHLRHIGTGLHAYATDFAERLPPSTHLSPNAYRPQEMMAASAGANLVGHVRWDGIGRLVDPRRSYLDTAEVLHCPSHDGDHEYERYADAYRSRQYTSEIFTNYHYRGDFDREKGRYFGVSGPRMVLVVDGMRTREDFNHEHGTNRLHSDGSVDWFADTSYVVTKSLPSHRILDDEQLQQQLYGEIWRRFDPAEGR